MLKKFAMTAAVFAVTLSAVSVNVAAADPMMMHSGMHDRMMMRRHKMMMMERHRHEMMMMHRHEMMHHNM